MTEYLYNGSRNKSTGARRRCPLAELQKCEDAGDAGGNCFGRLPSPLINEPQGRRAFWGRPCPSAQVWRAARAPLAPRVPEKTKGRGVCLLATRRRVCVCQAGPLVVGYVAPKRSGICVNAIDKASERCETNAGRS
ncbi:unnamed protein product [Amoebophrya sp. A120]|nr:unnamed protein product [Amoebophrya sp. A120]|eukprot:GSA120T00018202001.1